MDSSPRPAAKPLKDHFSRLLSALSGLLEGSKPQAELRRLLECAVLLSGARLGLFSLRLPGEAARLCLISPTAAGLAGAAAAAIENALREMQSGLLNERVWGAGQAVCREVSLELPGVGRVGSLLCAPAGHGEGCLGSLGLAGERGGFKACDLDLAAQVASCAAACLLAVGRRPETRARETEREEELRSLSHELKTPLSALALCHDLLDSERLGPLNDRQRQALDGGRRSLARLRADYARMVETICSPEWRANSLLIDVDLAAVAREAVAAIEPLAAARGLEVECDLPERIPLRGDRERLRQLLGNLLSNAVKYNRPGGRIVLRARREGADVRVEVSDTGLGVSEEEHGLLFEEHYRGSSAADSGAHGDGLGLAIVKRAVELHGGRISLESQQGRGTTFTVMLPGNTV